MKIAIFGGSFNPVHTEHINLVKSAIKNLGLNKVFILPSNITPNKSGTLFCEGKHRLNMCRLAFEGVGEAEVCDEEITCGGVSYSYITCQKFRKKYPHDELYFIVGADMLEDFPDWKNPQEILKCVNLAVCARESTAALDAAVEKIKTKFGAEPILFNYIGRDISSSKIRTLAALGEHLNGLITLQTAQYIKEHKLYFMPEIAEVKNLLSEERWQHTVRVAVMAAENCRRIGLDERSAIIMSALHDCAKYITVEGFTPPENVPPPVVHQYSGAFVAEHRFGIKDETILNAIRYHTSGRENMSAAEKLLFLCDMLESGRTFEGVEALRKIFERSIDECLFAALSHQVDYLKNSGKPIYPLTQKAYEYLKENL